MGSTRARQAGADFGKSVSGRAPATCLSSFEEGEAFMEARV